MTRSRATIAGAALIALAAGRPAAGQDVCPLRQLVEAAVPQAAGDRTVMARLLAVHTGPQLSRTFDRARAAGAVADGALRPDPGCERQPTGMCFYRNAGRGSLLFTRLRAGDVAYMNPARGFRGAAGIDNTITREAALQTARAALPGFGLPPTEVASGSVAVVKALARDTRQSAPTQVLRALLHVQFQRRIEGTPVSASDVRVIIGPEGNIARLYVRWPDFELQPGLRVEQTIPRADVVDQVVRRIAADNSCGSVAAVRAHITWAPATLVEPLGEADGAADDQGRFVPALLVAVIPPEVVENSGQISPAEQHFLWPLLDRGRE